MVDGFICVLLVLDVGVCSVVSNVSLNLWCRCVSFGRFCEGSSSVGRWCSLLVYRLVGWMCFLFRWVSMV